MKRIEDLRTSTYVVVHTQQYEDLKQLCQDFVNLYRELFENSPISAFKDDKGNMFMTLPDDMEFEYVGTFIDHLRHPIGRDSSFSGIGYVTIQKENFYNLPNQRVMFYLDDSSPDELVYFVTQENETYEFELGAADPLRRVDSKKKYLKEDIHVEKLTEVFEVTPNFAPLPKLPFKDRLKFNLKMVVLLVMAIALLLILRRFFG